MIKVKNRPILEDVHKKNQKSIDRYVKKCYSFPCEEDDKILHR